MIRFVLGAILGALGGYVYTSSPSFRKQLSGKSKKFKQLGDGFRMPLPSTSVDLPEDLEDFQLIDEVICECVSELADQLPADTKPEDLPTIFQLCVAGKFYAPEEVPWPPVPGDHPSIHELWAMLGFRIRRLLVRGEMAQVCGPQLTPGGGGGGGGDTGFHSGVSVDDWGEPQVQDLMDSGSVGGPNGGLWRVYKDNIGNMNALFYNKTWKQGEYKIHGPFDTVELARQDAISRLS